MEEQNIIALLPYQRPFLFVDAIDNLSENEIRGHYTFRKDEYFYNGHFKDNPGWFRKNLYIVICLGGSLTCP